MKGSHRGDKAAFIAGALAWVLVTAGMALVIQVAHVDTRHATSIFIPLAAALVPAGAAAFAICGLVAQELGVSGWVSLAVVFVISAGMNGVALVVLARSLHWARTRARPLFTASLAGAVAYEGLMLALALVAITGHR